MPFLRRLWSGAEETESSSLFSSALLRSIKPDREVDHSGPLQRETASDLDHVIGDHTQSHPTLHAVEPAIQTATHSMSPFQGADVALTSSPPALSTTKPALPIKSFAFCTLRLLIRHRKPSHSHGAGGLFILLRVKSCIRSHPSRNATESPLVDLDRRYQQLPVAGPFGKNFEMADDLIL